MTGRLARLLAPRSIALIGGRHVQRLPGELGRIGYRGAIWPVHPHADSLAGLPVHRSVAALPGVPDAAFVAVNREQSIRVVAELAAAGAGGAVCYASGFGEAGDGRGPALQQALLDAAGDMPLIGPNCYGFINYAAGVLLWPDAFGGRPLATSERGVALISQSSNIVINLDMQRRGLPVALVLTLGNRAQLGLAELGTAALAEPRVSTVGLYLEGIDDVAGLEHLASAARRSGKPLVVLKAGRTALARQAALTHTAALAGDDEAIDALFVRLGMARVDSPEALLEALKLLHVHGPLTGAQVLSLSSSGGEAALVADAARDTHIAFRAPGSDTRRRVQTLLGPLVRVSNPLDYHTFIWGNRERMQACFAALLAEGWDLALLLIDLPDAERADPRDWWLALDAFSDALRDTGQRGASVTCLADNLPEAAAAALLQRGLAPLAGLTAALAAVHAAIVIGHAWARPPAPALRAADDAPSTAAVLACAQPDEEQAKRWLATLGLAVPDGRRVASVAAACEAAATLGTPVAIKRLGVLHKSDAGALRLGLADTAQVRAAASELLGSAEELLVETMVAAPVAELLVGLHRAPPLGLVLTVASGGVLTELVADSRLLLLPCDEGEVRRALASLRAWRLLQGYRGGAVGDTEAAVSAVLAVAALAGRHGDAIEELDINPLMVCAAGRGAWVADALLRLRPGAASNHAGGPWT